MINKVIDINVNCDESNTNQNNTAAKLYTYILEDYPFCEGKNRPAIIICPGGGYAGTSDREAEPVATAFAAAGYHAFVLRYSCAPARYPTALLELASAVAIVRQNSRKWHVDENKIIICGFSAGGHLAACLGTMWQEDFLSDALNMENKSFKPNGMILCYPVISGNQEIWNEGSFVNLLGKNHDPVQLEMLSLEKRVNKQTPAAFLWHTTDDNVVAVENSLEFSQALRKNKISFEMHIYPHGPHGLSLSNKSTAVFPSHIQPDVENWFSMAVRFVENLV